MFDAHDFKTLEKLEKDIQHLRRAMEVRNLPLALGSIKRVRRSSTLLVKTIANTRDSLHVPEDDKP